MPDCIYLRDYRRKIEIGAFSEERGVKQNVAFTVTLELVQQAPLFDDGVDDILSYDVIVDAIDRKIAKRRYNLLEALAEDLAQALLGYEQVAAVDITIEKLDRVEGALGLRIRREGGNHQSDQVDSFHPRLILVYEGIPKIVEGDVWVAMRPDLQASTNYEQQRLRLLLDLAGWDLAEKAGLPMIDTLTEQRALISGGVNFVVGFGKRLFSANPPIATLKEETLINWLISELSPHEILSFGGEPPVGDFGISIARHDG